MGVLVRCFEVVCVGTAVGIVVVLVRQCVAAVRGTGAEL